MSSREKDEMDITLIGLVLFIIGFTLYQCSVTRDHVHVYTKEELASQARVDKIFACDKEGKDFDYVYLGNGESKVVCSDGEAR